MEGQIDFQNILLTYIANQFTRTFLFVYKITYLQNLFLDIIALFVCSFQLPKFEILMHILPFLLFWKILSNQSD